MENEQNADDSSVDIGKVKIRTEREKYLLAETCSHRRDGQKEFEGSRHASENHENFAIE